MYLSQQNCVYYIIDKYKKYISRVTWLLMCVQKACKYDSCEQI